MRYTTISVHGQWEKKVIRKIVRNKKMQWFPNSFRVKFVPARSESGVKLRWNCKERAEDVWTPLIWPVGPAAAGCTGHQVRRRRHTTVGGARPQQTGGVKHHSFILSTWRQDIYVQVCVGTNGAHADDWLVGWNTLRTAVPDANYNTLNWNLNQVFRGFFNCN